MKRKLFYVLAALLSVHRIWAQAPSWGLPPAGWDDFYVGLVNDFKVGAGAVNEPGYWVDVMGKANTLASYTPADPNKKSILYQYKYLNPDADTNTNWYQQQVITGLHITDHMPMDAAAHGIRTAWVVYMLQGHDGGTPEAVGHLQDVNYMQKYFWNLKYVAQKSNGKKAIFVIEPDMWGYLIKSQYLGGASPTISPGMLAYAGQVAVSNPAQFGYLAGLPNTLAGVTQGIIRTIRTFAPDAYVGLHVNTWPCLDPDPYAARPGGAKPNTCPGGVCPGGPGTGLVWRGNTEIDWSVNFMLNFYNGLFPANADKGDFLVMEKYGANAGNAGWTEWGWNSAAMQKWLYFSQKMGQGFCRPLLMWQIQLGQTDAAAATLATATSTTISPLANTAGRYRDSFVEFMFQNFNQVLDAGFIGCLAGKGLPGMTEYSIQNGYGDNGYFFKGLNYYINPGRPYDLNRGLPQPSLPKDTTLCGTGGTLTLNPGNMGASIINWSTGATSPTINVSAPGTYWVRVSGTGCPKSDTVTVSNTFAVNLGPNRSLCNPANVLLDADHQGIGVTYLWKLNGTNIPAPTGTARYLSVTQAGTYEVTVTDPSCMPAKTSSVVLSSGSVTPNGPTCFPSPSGTALLSVVNSGGSYQWYTGAIGGSVLNTGVSYTTPVLSATTTYYVEDVAQYPTTVMPKVNADGYTNSTGVGAPNSGPDGTSGSDWLTFDALYPFTLKSFTIDAKINFCGGTRRGGIVIRNALGTTIYDSGLITFPCSAAGVPNVQTITITLPGAGASIPVGTGFQWRYYTPFAPAGEANMVVYQGTGGTLAYPRTYNNVLRVTGYSNPSASNSIFGHPGTYNWNITAQQPCARVPVTAIPCVIVPIHWLYFQASLEMDGALLRWAMANEENDIWYEVQRSSDGRNFEVITQVHSASPVGQYQYLDPSGLPGGYYYRIRAVNDTEESLSSIVYLSRNNRLGYLVFPNPFEETVSLKFEEGVNVEVKVFDAKGGFIGFSRLPQGGQLVLGEQWASGMYILEFRAGDQRVYTKIFKQ